MSGFYLDDGLYIPTDSILAFPPAPFLYPCFPYYCEPQYYNEYMHQMPYYCPPMAQEDILNDTHIIELTHDIQSIEAESKSPKEIDLFVNSIEMSIPLEAKTEQVVVHGALYRMNHIKELVKNSVKGEIAKKKSKKKSAIKIREDDNWLDQMTKKVLDEKKGEKLKAQASLQMVDQIRKWVKAVFVYHQKYFAMGVMDAMKRTIFVFRGHFETESDILIWLKQTHAHRVKNGHLRSMQEITSKLKDVKPLNSQKAHFAELKKTHLCALDDHRKVFIIIDLANKENDNRYETVMSFDVPNAQIDSMIIVE